MVRSSRLLAPKYQSSIELYKNIYPWARPAVDGTTWNTAPQPYERAYTDEQRSWPNFDTLCCICIASPGDAKAMPSVPAPIAIYVISSPQEREKTVKTRNEGTYWYQVPPKSYPIRTRPRHPGILSAGGGPGRKSTDEKSTPPANPAGKSRACGVAWEVSFALYRRTSHLQLFG
ncbi:hypothetical protein OF83DRAFT_413763 [Amylostereum chailletii]|nr:hypothetical protein OF83DRAFT_413763 [Amylostereum chailletii]